MNSRRFAIPMLAVTLAAAGLGIKAARNLPQAQPPGQANTQPPSEAEIRDRAVKLAQNQHNDDNALELYERIEHQVDRTGGASPRVLGDKVYRVVPDGAGTVKLLVKSDGKPVDPAEYQRQLLAWRDLLELALKPDDSRFKAASAKWEKKKHDRADLVDGAREAFVTKWLGQEMRNGRLCDVFELEPNPKYRPHSMFQDALTRVTAKTWVDHETNQLARGEAHATRDISFGGGILGKLYRGGVFSLEQAEVAPGIWLAVRYQYDFTARRFLFPFEEHQYIEVSRYRRLGPPKQALEIVRNELATGKGANADP